MAAKEINIDADIASVTLELGIICVEDKQTMTLKAFLSILALLLTGFVYVKWFVDLWVKVSP